MVNESICSALVLGTCETLFGALTICNGTRLVTVNIVPNGISKGKSAIPTWASPTGTLPIYRVLLTVRTIVPGCQRMVGHQEIVGKSTLENTSLPCWSVRIVRIFKGGVLTAFTF